MLQITSKLEKKLEFFLCLQEKFLVTRLLEDWGSLARRSAGDGSKGWERIELALVLKDSSCAPMIVGEG